METPTVEHLIDTILGLDTPEPFLNHIYKASTPEIARCGILRINDKHRMMHAEYGQLPRRMHKGEVFSPCGYCGAPPCLECAALRERDVQERRALGK